MIGTALFLYALLTYIDEHLTEVRMQIQFTTEDRRETPTKKIPAHARR